MTMIDEHDTYTLPMWAKPTYEEIQMALKDITTEDVQIIKKGLTALRQQNERAAKTHFGTAIGEAFKAAAMDVQKVMVKL